MYPDLYVPVPPGWKRTDDLSTNSIVVEGPVPDTDKQRNCYVRVVLAAQAQPPRLKWRGGSLRVRREVLEMRWNPQTRDFVATGRWHKAGLGGPRVLGTLLIVLAEGGRHP